MAAEPGPNFRWGIVTRRSRYNRDGTEGSTARQEQAIHEHLKANGTGRVVAVYSDVASAYSEKDRRQEFVFALDDLRAGRIDGLIAWKVDRLLRRRKEARRLLSLLEECGGRLATVVEGIDTADPVKREITEIAFAIYAGAAESESESIGERVALMHLDRARKGLVQSPGRPFGHTTNWFGLVAAEVEVVREMAQRVLDGEAPHSIARDLTQRGVPTSKGNLRWHSEQVRRILTSARMIGQREYGGQLYVLEGVPPILDEDTWQRVCATIEGRASNPGPRVTHLLSSLAVCGVCGRTLAAAVPGQGKPTYVCRPHFEGDQACRKISVVRERADAVVRERVIDFLADHERVRRLLREQTQGTSADAVHERIGELSESLLALGQALNPPPGVPRMELAVYYEQAAAIEAERQQLQRRLAVTREAALLAETLEFDDPAAEWDARGLEWQRTILRLVTKRIVIQSRGKASVQPGKNVFDPRRVVVEFA
jgi:site-specific DNA recombinase